MPDAACTVFYSEALRRLPEVSLSDGKNWAGYDVALFMTYKVDLQELKKVKLQFPKLKTGIIDPRGEWVKQYLPYVDFLIVDSLEMRDYWAYCELPIFEYAEYPDLKPQKKICSTPSDGNIIVGYHGNRIHLEAMHFTTARALERLSDKYSIELWAMYNLDSLGKWTRNVPDIKVRHIQWSMENYEKYLSEADIGLVPTFIPERSQTVLHRLFSRLGLNRYCKTPDDYLLRFKMPTNPGRIIVWGLLNIPVVADFFPSAMQCIKDGESGFLAYSEGGWYKAIEKLIVDRDLRRTCADNLSAFVEERYDFNNQNKVLIHFLKKNFTLQDNYKPSA